jgi:cell division protein FtsB
MKTLIGGAVAAALGLLGLGVWWGEFLMVLTGIIPVMLLLGGGLALYLGFDELKDTLNKDEAVESDAQKDEEMQRYKEEIDGLKEEIKNLKEE